MNDNFTAVYASQQPFKPLLWKDETFIHHLRQYRRWKRERNAPICFFTLRNLPFPPHRPEDGLYLTTCIFNRSIINRCFAVWDAWFMRAICKLVRLHWKLESLVSISEGTGLDCTIAQQRAYTIREEALQLMHHYKKQIRSYATHNHRCRLPQHPMPSQN